MTDGTPVIGLTAYEEQVRWGVWDVPGVLLPSTYLRAVVTAGGAADPDYSITYVQGNLTVTPAPTVTEF